jgi:hypothetical protein
VCQPFCIVVGTRVDPFVSVLLAFPSGSLRAPFAMLARSVPRIGCGIWRKRSADCVVAQKPVGRPEVAPDGFVVTPAGILWFLLGYVRLIVMCGTGNTAS